MLEIVNLLSNEDNLLEFSKLDYRLAAENIVNQKPLIALKNLCKKLPYLSKENKILYQNIIEVLTEALISHSQSLEELEKIKDHMGILSKDPILSIFFLARETFFRGV